MTNVFATGNAVANFLRIKWSIVDYYNDLLLKILKM